MSWNWKPDCQATRISKVNALARPLEQLDASARLLELMSRKEPVLAPGAYDALTARIVEDAGFDAVYMTGFGTAASRLGRPDVGLVTMTEMVENARHIVDAVHVPVIADADTGYGNPVNIIRTVHEFESAGVAGIHIEDQTWPKKCGHMEGKHVIPAEEMVEKIRAAVFARRSSNFLIIARTDSRAIEGLSSALNRGRLYREAGADVIFIEAPQSEEEIVTISESFKGVPLLLNWLEGGKTPPMPFPRIAELGFRIVIFPLATLLSATKAMREVLSELRKDGTPIRIMDRLTSFRDFLNLIGLREISELERSYVHAGK
jgi:2-methylisocitrate lyase-like PEP mutase family enzyme